MSCDKMTYFASIDAYNLHMRDMGVERHGGSSGLTAILARVHIRPQLVLVCTGFVCLKTL